MYGVNDEKVEHKWGIDHGHSSSLPPVEMSYDGQDVKIVVGWHNDNEVVINWRDMERIANVFLKWREAESE